MKYCFIINPAAGKGKIASEWTEKVREACTRRALDFSIYRTQAVGDATDYVIRTAAEHPEQHIRFYACGGDGTLGETATGLMSLPDSSRASLGLVPMGTGNDFARNFSPSESFFDADAQLDAEPMPIDVLRCNDRYAVNMVNIGFDCEVVVKTARLKRHPLIPSKLAYIAGLVATLIRKPGVDMALSLDGGKEEAKHFLLTTFAGGGFCGGGFHSNPATRLDDGKIDAILVNNVTRRKFISLVGDYKKGTHLTPKFEGVLSHIKASCVNMRFPKLTNVSVDGEIVQTDALRLEVVHNAIPFLLPRGAGLVGAEG